MAGILQDFLLNFYASLGVGWAVPTLPGSAFPPPLGGGGGGGGGGGASRGSRGPPQADAPTLKARPPKVDSRVSPCFCLRILNTEFCILGLQEGLQFQVGYALYE